MICIKVPLDNTARSETQITMPKSDQDFDDEVAIQVQNPLLTLLDMLHLQSNGSKTKHGEDAHGAEGGSVVTNVGGLGLGVITASRLVSGSGSGRRLLDRRVDVGAGLGSRLRLRLASRVGVGGRHGRLAVVAAGVNGDGGGLLRFSSRRRVLAELLSSGEDIVNGNLGGALVDDAFGGITLNLVEALADAGKIGDLAIGVCLDGLVKARNSALGDVGEGLGLRKGGDGDGGESVLHLD